MRPVSMLPLALATFVLAGCGDQSQSGQETATTIAREAASPERDLTLRAPATPVVEIASPVELSRPTSAARPTRRAVSRKHAMPAPASTPAREAPPAAEAPALSSVAAAVVSVEEAPVEDVAVGAGRELAPGKTVTAIPVSSGPSYAPEADDSWLPSGPSRGILVGGGDTCRRRGGARGIGIGGRIPGGVPRHRLR